MESIKILNGLRCIFKYIDAIWVLNIHARLFHTLIVAGKHDFFWKLIIFLGTRIERQAGDWWKIILHEIGSFLYLHTHRFLYAILSLFYYDAVISKYRKQQLLYLIPCCVEIFPVFHEKKNYNFGHNYCHHKRGEVAWKIYIL